VQHLFERHREIQASRAASDELEVGFTLIELLIVIVVLGILAAIVIFSLTGVTASSAVSACNSDAKTAQIAVQAYDAQKGGFPTSNITDNASATTAGIVPAYLHTWPNNPQSNYAISWNATAQEIEVAIGGGAPIYYDSQTSSDGCNSAT
jgi:prepilin-type N-terminal cleavage/methylation domain-containing protein